MADLERFLHDEQQPYPTLVKAGLAHVQCETIHPFLDGNGRLGRLLISFILHQNGLLSRALLYLSLYFKRHRSRYYELLDQVRRTGDWEHWIDFFLEGVEKTAEDAVGTARRLVSLFRKDENRIQALGRRSSTVLHCFRVFCRRPIQTINDVGTATGNSYPTAAKGGRCDTGITGRAEGADRKAARPNLRLRHLFESPQRRSRAAVSKTTENHIEQMALSQRLALDGETLKKDRPATYLVAVRSIQSSGNTAPHSAWLCIGRPQAVALRLSTFPNH